METGSPLSRWSRRRLLVAPLAAVLAAQETRPRARALGLRPGILPPGTHNALTDVAAVQVGHASLIRGESVRTGVTAILPHAGNLFQEKVPAAVFIGNAFGKLMGSTQVNELGEIETPVLLTNTLSVPRAADALLEWMLALPGNEQVRSINPVVGETNDGYLNDIRARAIGRDEVFAALRAAAPGPVAEGCVGAGVGTVAFGFKGGIGTASRVVPKAAGGFTVGALVQSNYGGVLTIQGAPVGLELGVYYLKDELGGGADGSVMVVVATDAPLEHRNLYRLAARAMLGLARTGSGGSNGSGDYVIAFSAAPGVRLRHGAARRQAEVLGNDAMSPLFLAAIEAVEEAVYNSLFQAVSMTGYLGRRVEALPVGRTVQILRRYGAVQQ
jgi:D-aminopeptidase